MIPPQTDLIATIQTWKQGNKGDNNDICRDWGIPIGIIFIKIMFTGPYADFWKWRCEFKGFYKESANAKKILILRPKLGV